MPLLGTQWKPRYVTRLCWDNHWHDANILMTMVCIISAESNRYDHAYHYNDPQEGGDGSTDWGMFQLNDANKGGHAPDAFGTPQPGGVRPTADVTAFRDKAWDPYQAAITARGLYVSRGFQPWAAYDNGAYKQFIPESCRAMCNFLAILNGLQPLI